MDGFDWVYETMLGLLEPEAMLPGIENAFFGGSFCAREYETMRSAYLRLCQRLGVADEDGDLNCMIESLENIQRELCRRIWELHRAN